MADEPLLLEESIRRKLDQLTLVPTKVRAGAIKGERRSKKRGTSIEFADYRDYAPGDDLRRLDWNVYARLERPYIKLLEDEEDLAVHVILDASASMDWPKEGDGYPLDQHKATYARRLFAGLGYVALSSNDRVMMAAINDHGVEYFGPARGRGQGLPMLKYVHQVKPRGATDLNVALRDYAVRATRPGMTFIISDMFSASGFVDGLNALIGKGHEVAVLHVLSPDEVEPPLTGDLRLVDSETGRAQEVSVDSNMRAMYIQRVQEWRDGIRAECARRGAKYLPLVTDVAWEKALLFDLRRMNLVK
jgi:uncharacterized protein (DUF58 family)